MKDDEADWDSCPLGIRHETELKEIQRRVDVIEKAIVDIRDCLLGRPSWLVALALTFMFGISSSLAVYILTHK